MAKAPKKAVAGADPERASGAAAEPPVVILHGAERYLILQHTEALRRTLIARYGEIDTFTFDGNSATPADILDECRSVGLMAPRKLVIVDNTDALLRAGDDDDTPAAPAPRGGPRRRGEKSARELFEGYASQPEAATTLVLRSAAWRPGKLDEKVLSAGGLVEKCDTLGDAAAAKWAIESAKASWDVTLPRPAADLLIKNLGNELGRLESEVAKLALNAGPGGSIAEAAVKASVEVEREVDAWSIQSTLLEGDPVKSLHELKERIETSRLSPVLIGIAYIDLARKVAGSCTGLALGKRDSEVSSEQRLWGASSGPILAAARRIKPRQAAALLKAAIEVDVRQKTGGDGRDALEGLTLKFAAAFGGTHTGAQRA
ncbi:hypothetical protein BH11PLA1_BH11PLA1_23330 [soil metagenome]